MALARGVIEFLPLANNDIIIVLKGRGGGGGRGIRRILFSAYARGGGGKNLPSAVGSDRFFSTPFVRENGIVGSFSEKLDELL